jgi:hypothetical protein
MRFGRPGFLRETLRSPQTRGFIWGFGAATAAYFLLPAIKEAVRPTAKGVVRGAMVAGDRFRSAMAGAREGLEDIVAEAQYDRMRGMAEPDLDASVDTVTQAIQPRTPNDARN